MNDRFGYSIVINMSSSSAAKLHNSVNNSDRFPERAPLIGYLVFISYTRCCDFDVNCPSQSKWETYIHVEIYVVKQSF